MRLRTVLYADLPGLGPQDILMEVRKRVYIPKLLKIEVAGVDVAKLGVTNFESIPFTVKQINYRFRVADDLDVQGQETKAVTLKKKGAESMPIHVSFQPKAIPKGLFKTLFEAKRTAYRLTGSATVAASAASTKEATRHFTSTGTAKDLLELATKKD